MKRLSSDLNTSLMWSSEWGMWTIISLCGILSVLQRVRELLLARDEEVRQEVLFPIVLRLRISTNQISAYF